MGTKKLCLYCGAETDYYHNVCRHCRKKLPVVRRLVAAGRMILMILGKR